jgi:hypothetical protein
MARRVDNEDSQAFSYRCYLGFVNLGDTFAESLHRASVKTLAEIEAYVKRCRRQGCTLSDATLWTLCAIQDGITSVPEADRQGRGGYGMQEMLDLVSLLGHSEKPGHSPAVTIISGNTCIRLREPHVSGKRMNGDHSPRVLWCNATNSAEMPPLNDFVFDLPYRIPGSIISMHFILDPDFLRGKDRG